ncbi:hypothetical protein BJX63DRAFT_438408 [Aspergillus granulosus]|uniref:SRR1-like domain-containing protein n=1 Tax=Aspergillus granulosus TaxID=176169 RepID=A0ABR4GS12_9EURO
MSGTEEDERRNEEDLTEAVASVRRLYDSSAPFFTKNRIREAYESLQESKKSGKRVHVRRLDGKLESFKIHHDRVSHVPQDGSEWIERPSVYYLSLQSLLDETRIGATTSPYSNIRIVHYRERRNKLDGQPSQPEVAASLQRAIVSWRDSQSWAQMRSALGRFQLGKVKKIVAFALGSLQTFSDEMKRANRSAFQHAFLITLRDYLLSYTTQGDSEAKCYAQDPAYTEHDTAVLQSQGITIVPDPEGFLEVNQETVVISISPNIPVRQVVLEISRPILVIWDSIEGDGFGGLPMTDPDSPRLQKWITEHYETVGSLSELDYFGDVSVYVRRF